MARLGLIVQAFSTRRGRHTTWFFHLGRSSLTNQTSNVNRCREKMQGDLRTTPIRVWWSSPGTLRRGGTGRSHRPRPVLRFLIKGGRLSQIRGGYYGDEQRKRWTSHPEP